MMVIAIFLKAEEEAMAATEIHAIREMATGLETAHLRLACTGTGAMTDSRLAQDLPRMVTGTAEIDTNAVARVVSLKTTFHFRDGRRTMSQMCS